MGDKSILILGGIGFIGRNLVKYLVDKNLAAKIKVIDKALPATAYFAAETQKAFSDPRVETKQANLVNKATLEKAFAEHKWNLVINCAGETKPASGTGDEGVYKEKIEDLTANCAAVVAQNGAKWVQISTGQVYEPGKKPSGENDKLAPWTTIAKYHLNAEKKLAETPNLNFSIIRSAIVYGPADVTGIAPRLIAAATYVQMGSKMELLWDEKLRINTVHVNDVCKACLLVGDKGAQGGIYNLCDKNDTNQGMVNKHIESIFKIKTGFMGTLINQAAKLNLEYAVEKANEKHLKPWSDICKKHSIVNTPLTPYMDIEIMGNNPLCLDGSKVEKDLGFTYDHPKMEEGELRKIVQYYLEQNLFPPIMN